MGYESPLNRLERPDGVLAEGDVAPPAPEDW
jgi:hypothetical protein